MSVVHDKGFSEQCPSYLLSIDMSILYNMPLINLYTLIRYFMSKRVVGKSLTKQTQQGSLS